MAPHTSSLPIAAVGPLIERRHIIRRESLRDFVGVAVGVGAAGLLWLAFLSFTRLPL